MAGGNTTGSLLRVQGVSLDARGVSGLGEAQSTAVGEQLS